MKNTKIIAAFPACGKSYYYKNHPNDIIVLDSDSSQFSWTYLSNDTKVKNPDFPNNYIEHIKENIGKADYIFISTHDVVRQALNNENIDYILLFPERKLKNEWLKRCSSRGSDKQFCDNLNKNWDTWMDQLEEESKTHTFYKLKSGEYLTDIINYIQKQ